MNSEQNDATVNYQLEEALMYAGQASDINSLKTLARQEARQADRIGQLLSAVLAVTGPVRLRRDQAELAGASFVVVVDGDDLIIESRMPNSGAE